MKFLKRICFFLFLVIAPTFAAYSLGTAAQAADVSSGNTLTCTPTYLVHDGSWVVVTYGNGSTIATTITDGTNTYTQIGTTINDATHGQSMAQFYSNDVAAGTPTVSFILVGTADFRGMFVLPIHGLDNTATPVGGGQLQSAPGSGTDAITSGNITPLAQPAFFGGFAFNDNSGSETFVGGTGFTDRGGLSTWTGQGFPAARYEDVRITSTSNKAATFTAGIGTNNNFTLAITIPEPSGASTWGVFGNNDIFMLKFGL